MNTKSDYSSEIMGVIVLAALSAASHFWLIMIALGAALIVAGTGFLISRLLVRARRDLVARMLSTPNYDNPGLNSEVSINGARGSLPVA